MKSEYNEANYEHVHKVEYLLNSDDIYLAEFIADPSTVMRREGIIVSTNNAKQITELFSAIQKNGDAAKSDISKLAIIAQGKVPKNV